MATEEILKHSLQSIATALRQGEYTAQELTELAVARHQALGVNLNAYKTWSVEAARQAAQVADAVFAAKGDLGPLQGIPISVKDLFGVRGLPTFAGTPRRLPQHWEREGPIVTRLRKQLAVITGKTHTVELAFGGLGLNNHWGTPRNPWDAWVHRVPGGSSSGAGVSLCEGSALLALGTDTAGSVRIPASMTGNVGLKTSFGRWPLEGIVPLSPTFDTVGILARSVADLIYGFTALDSAALETSLAHTDIARLRIGVGDRVMWENCDPGIAEVAQAALNELSARGAQVHDFALPEAQQAIDLLAKGSVVSAECDAFLDMELPEWRQLLDPIIATRIADGGAIPAREYLLRQRLIRELAAKTETRLQAVDVLASPTVSLTPPAVDQLTVLEDYRRYNLASLRNTCVANFLGLCALTLPVGLDQSGMPVGLQLIARHHQEERLLAAALAIEDVLGNAEQRLGMAPLSRL